MWVVGCGPRGESNVEDTCAVDLDVYIDECGSRHWSGKWVYDMRTWFNGELDISCGAHVAGGHFIQKEPGH